MGRKLKGRAVGIQPKPKQVADETAIRELAHAFADAVNRRGSRRVRVALGRRRRMGDRRSASFDRRGSTNILGALNGHLRC